MLSQTVEYALRAIVCLANESPSAQTNVQIAKVTKVPAAYLSKVMASLNRAGLVHSQRGPNGGFTLAKKPDELALLEVVNAVDPIRRIETCPLDLPGHGTRLCPLHRRMDNAIKTVEQAFANTTLAEVLADSNGSKPLCDTSNNDTVNLS
ncbi:HTH-type transcriptional regulator CymR [Symmachiella macrocystis]|uniref:HTH-type transcriptional regulator CymR n=1 Tax=Symmachiella macrocystis TaxID=2527985 RepID=A0A5C6B5F0_9PLAN|nr:Rrf2 family transcriptional regulator [Symmachiella macrocystis]TWU07168.1 HTH-type transcriptional regulator CymR [Symmachiella macrocystis]